MIYTKDGQVPLKAYSVDGDECMYGYNKQGANVYESLNQYISGRHVVFEDDFDGNALNADAWTFDIGVMNNGGEEQYYKSENASVENSCLVITAKKETVGSKTWTSARVVTAGKNGWRYGRFEAKIKFPGVVGAFPAFWLMGLNHKDAPNESGTYSERYDGSVSWPVCGELDIIEFIPGNSKRPISTVWPNRNSDPYQHLFQVSPDYDVTSSDWHTYAVDINSDYITFYIDNVQVGNRMKLSDYDSEDIEAFSKPLHILINLAIKFGTPIVNEMKMYVDWVRVYAPQGISSDVSASEIILPDELTLEAGSQYFMYPTFSPDTVSNRNINWYSTNASVAECDAGVITAKTVGTSYILAGTKNGIGAITKIIVT